MRKTPLVDPSKHKEKEKRSIETGDGDWVDLDNGKDLLVAYLGGIADYRRQIRSVDDDDDDDFESDDCEFVFINYSSLFAFLFIYIILHLSRDTNSFIRNQEYNLLLTNIELFHNFEYQKMFHLEFRFFSGSPVPLYKI